MTLFGTVATFANFIGILCGFGGETFINANVEITCSEIGLVDEVAEFVNTAFLDSTDASLYIQLMLLLSTLLIVLPTLQMGLLSLQRCY